jgi:hypothetical protein
MPAPAQPTGPQIESTLLDLAASHTTGTPIDLLMVFSVQGGKVDVRVVGAINRLMFRGLISDVHDILADLDSESFESVELRKS